MALDLHDANLTAAPGLSAPETKAVQLLTEEVEKRTGLHWSTTQTGPHIFIRHASGAGPAEGYHVFVRNQTVTIEGNDERGTLFGVGRFLRELQWDRGQASISDSLDITSSPKYALRGHQIGYRPKVNTYDAWTPAMFEQYVRDLAIFGTNAIELIPPRSDDDDLSPHFPLPKLEMMIEMSRIIASYGLQVWIWFPAMDPDLSKPEAVNAALTEWGDIFQKLPRVDAVFVPAGDPGDSRPKILISFLEKEAGVMRRYHPKAQMWVSAQNFDAAALDEFIGVLDRQPAWLNGVVYGPWTRVTLPELRARVPKRYPIRRYPDITHSIHCEYPVPGWDTAYAVTEARETINPRPVDQSKIFRLTSPQSIGFITYSEGVNDDVNKIVWSSLGWDPDANIAGVLREFARWFISPRHADGIAQGILALERDWRGPLLANASVEETFAQFQSIERSATPQMLLNWRFQQLLYRANYDAYVRRRLLYETTLERQALDALAAAPRTGSLLAMEESQRTLNQALTHPVAADLRTRIFTLAEALYQSIHMQLSVDRYKAIAVSRGANLDTVDFPLNNRFWLEKQFAGVRKLATERERLTALDVVLNRTNPGPGGFYDDLGNTAMQPHLVDEGPGYDGDPGGFRSPRSSWAAFSGGLIGRSSLEAVHPEGPARFLEAPKAWWDWANARYETPLTMRYTDLDPTARYKVRVVYIPETTKVRLVANGSTEIHGYIERPEPATPLEFDIPAEATRSGTLTLRWSIPAGIGGFDGSIGIAEVFLIKVATATSRVGPLGQVVNPPVRQPVHPKLAVVPRVLIHAQTPGRDSTSAVCLLTPVFSPGGCPCA